MKRRHYGVLPLAFGACMFAAPLPALADGAGYVAGKWQSPTSVEDSFLRIPEVKDPDASGKGNRSPDDIRRSNVAATVRAAQALAAKDKNQEALQKLNELDSVQGKGNDEVYVIERTRLAIASRMNDEALIRKSAEAIMTTDQAPAAERIQLESTLARGFYNRKDFPQAISWMTRYFKDGGNDSDMHMALARSYYFVGDYAHAISEAHADVDIDEKAGMDPPKDLVGIWLNSAGKVNDHAEYMRALEKAAAYYPKKEYWSALLNSLVSRPGFPESLSLDVYRLMWATGQIDKADDYVSMAQSALQSNYPALAKRVMDQGFESGLLGHGPNATTQKQLRDSATKSAASEEAKLDNEAATGEKSGDKMLGIGYRYVDHGDFDKGIKLMEEGIKTGQLRRPEEAKLRLGVAYLMAGRRDDAARLLESVQGQNGIADLARYWMVYFDGKRRADAASKPA